MTTAKEVAQIRKMEIAPIKEEIKSAHYFASRRTTDFQEYTELMYSRGVEIKPSINKQGQMQGFRVFGLNIGTAE